MELVKPLDPYTLAPVDEAWRNRSAGVKGHAVPHEAFTQSMAEIVNFIEKSGLTPDGEDQGQLWTAFAAVMAGALVEGPGIKLEFDSENTRWTVSRKVDASGTLTGPGSVDLLNLKPDSYYILRLTSDVVATYTIVASTNGGVSWRSDYRDLADANTYLNIDAQQFSFAGDLDYLGVYTGSADVSAAFFRTSNDFNSDYSRFLKNAPRGLVNAIRISTDAQFQVAAELLLF